MLALAREVFEVMVAHCLDGFPLEACGLLGGAGGDHASASACYPTANAAASAKLYTVEPRDMLRADRAADAAGIELIGVFHSHTHTDAYPSPTDVELAPDPGWHYVLVSLRDAEPSVRSYRIRGGNIEEEAVVLE
ncbi:MAG: Mov34/MPN/PAD-1 family protein [Acidimicrobiales bacterium]